MEKLLLVPANTFILPLLVQLLLLRAQILLSTEETFSEVQLGRVEKLAINVIGLLSICDV